MNTFFYGILSFILYLVSRLPLWFLYGLSDILFTLDQAKSDDQIKGIYIDIDELNCGISTARTIRQALDDFKKSSDKFVIAYFQGEGISQKEYYIG